MITDESWESPELSEMFGVGESDREKLRKEQFSVVGVSRDLPAIM